MSQHEPSALMHSEGFRHRVDVRFHELDSFSVFHMWYLAYFDDAMIAYFRSHGIPHKSIFIQLVRTELDLRKASVRRGDHLDVAVRPTHIGRSSFTLEFSVLHGDAGTVVVVGKTVYVCVAIGADGTTSKQPIPPVVLDALQADFLAEFDKSG